jgi:hypothetical protein
MPFEPLQVATRVRERWRLAARSRIKIGAAPRALGAILRGETAPLVVIGHAASLTPY